MPSFCCPECFGDRGLRKSIIPAVMERTGTCSYCLAERAILVSPSALQEYFHLLIGVYEENDEGVSLVEWIKSDWGLFSHPRMYAAHAKELLADILEDGDIVRRRFIPSPDFQSEGLIRWESLRDELMYKNRYFLDESLDTDRLTELLHHLPADDLPDRWFRARMRSGDAVLTLEDMGSPPKRLATHGRANPPGIPYLYLGSLAETAVAEIRPHTGESAWVARFSIPGPIAVVDLRNPRKLVSPFLLADSESVGQMRADIPFLERLGDELTKPVLPQGAAIDYIPSQFLCEFIKKSGFDGVVYRSAVSDGINLALFDAAKATPVDVKLFHVSKVSVAVHPSA